MFCLKILFKLYYKIQRVILGSYFEEYGFLPLQDLNTPATDGFSLTIEKVAKSFTIYCVLLRIPDLIKKKVTVRFLDIAESNPGKVIVNTYWELACTIKQTRRDRMMNTASHIMFLQ